MCGYDAEARESRVYEGNTSQSSYLDVRIDEDLWEWEMQVAEVPGAYTLIQNTDSGAYWLLNDVYRADSNFSEMIQANEDVGEAIVYLSQFNAYSMQAPEGVPPNMYTLVQDGYNEAYWRLNDTYQANDNFPATILAEPRYAFFQVSLPQCAKIVQVSRSKSSTGALIQTVNNLRDRIISTAKPICNVI